jgi:Zn-dependent M28 family amino/carboxypeptidase
MRRAVVPILLASLAACTTGDPSATTGSAAPAAITDAATSAAGRISADAIRAHMRFLADDALEGRGTGTRGYDLAAKYVAAQFEALGLSPAGDGGSYFQPVPLRSTIVDGARSSVSFRYPDREESLTFATDWTALGDPGRDDVSVEAPVVFVGAGVTAPDQNYDDYRGIDVTGKIVAWVYPTPPFESTLKAHYSSGATRRANAAAHGAAGWIRLADPVSEKQYSFAMSARDNNNAGFNWLDSNSRPNDYHEPLRGAVQVNMDVTRKLFAASGRRAEDVFAAAQAGKAQPFDMQVTARLRKVTTRQDITSPNVVARLEGSDPVLKNEHVVYTAHLDHVGIGGEVKGDRIYNGALDNASGTAVMLELARAFSTMQPRPKRSLLFVAVTAEEAGLLGSDYFAHYPTVPKASIVANVNLDESAILWPLRDVIAYGAEHSTLGPLARQAAERVGIALSPDPAPEQVLFVRSDQYSFVKQGVPSVFTVVGFKSDDATIKPKEIWDKWEAERYHQPQDDMQQPGLRFGEAVTFAKFNFLLGYLVAQDAARPAWNPGNFFGERYGTQAKSGS